MSIKPSSPQKTPAPPKKTKSGEIPSVREFQEDIAKYNDEIVPQMDAQVDRMTELYKKVSGSPEESDRVMTPVPRPPRSPSFVDEDELDDDLPTNPGEKKP